MEYKSNRNVVYPRKYHVVWCPRDRRRVLVNRVDERLKAIPEEVAKETRSDILEMEVMPDRVSILVEVDPQFDINTLLRRMKGRSSFLLRREFPWLGRCLPAVWTNSYFISTVSGAPLARVKQYIESQKRSAVR